MLEKICSQSCTRANFLGIKQKSEGLAFIPEKKSAAAPSCCTSFLDTYWLLSPELKSRHREAFLPSCSTTWTCTPLITRDSTLFIYLALKEHVYVLFFECCSILGPSPLHEPLRHTLILPRRTRKHAQQPESVKWKIVRNFVRTRLSREESNVKNLTQYKRVTVGMRLFRDEGNGIERKREQGVRG